MIIGITGKSGSGKSTVSKYIASLGYFVIDVDIIHKKLAQKHEKEIEDIFKNCGFGTLNKKERIKEFFANQEIRKIINSLLFSKTVDEIKEVIKNKKDELIFLDAPLLYDMNLDELCNEIWYIYCNPEENIKRLMKRNGVTKEEAWSRYNAINFEDRSFTYKIDTTTDIPKEIINQKISKAKEETL